MKLAYILLTPLLALASCVVRCESALDKQPAQTEQRFLFDEEFTTYTFIGKKDIDGTVYSLFVEVSGFSDKVEFVQVYEGDLERAFKNREKVPYYKPLVYKDIEEGFPCIRRWERVRFSDDNASIIIDFDNGEQQIIPFERTPPPQGEQTARNVLY